MGYIEALIYYIGVVGAVFVLLYIILFLLLLIVGWIQNKRKDTKIDYFSDFIISIVKSKFLKLFRYFYLVVFSLFLIIKIFDYFGTQRAYPQAKAYKIVADVSTFYFETFIASRNLYFKPSGLKYIEPYEEWQNYLMQKAFKYIPKDDAERAIWRYEYYYANYVRARIAPIDFDKLNASNLRMLIVMSGHPTLHKPIAREMLEEVERLVDMLMSGNMQDKTYSNINRYMVTTLFASWIEDMHFLKYTLGVTSPRYRTDEYINLRYSWTEDKAYLNRTDRLVNFLDKTKKKIEQDKNLKSFLKKHKYIYPNMTALRVGLMARLVYVDLLYREFSCDLQSLQRYVKNREEFLEYSKGDRVYRRFSKRERRLVEKSVVYRGNYLIRYILYKKCNLKENRLMIREPIETGDWGLSNTPSIKTKKIIQRITDER